MGECRCVTPGVITNPSHVPGQDAKFLIAKQKYLEYLEAGKTTAALQVLRNELAPLNPELDHLHALSRYVHPSFGQCRKHMSTESPPTVF